MHTNRSQLYRNNYSAKYLQLAQASTHKTVKTQAGTVFVTCDLDPKINVFPVPIIEHLYVQFGDPSYSSFWYLRYCVDKQTNTSENTTPATAVGCGNYNFHVRFHEPSFPTYSTLDQVPKKNLWG